MYTRVLHQMRERIRTKQYVMTLHAEEEKEDDALSIFDVEHAILTGEILERQQDQHSGEWKYLITGQAIDDQVVTTVCKLSVTGKLIILTVYIGD